MAMPPANGNVIMSDKMQFGGAGSGGGGGNEIHQHHLRQQWFPVDERDGFISWLRAEFAAANAIIDSLCNHMRAISEPGEYDLVIGCVQQRRCNWNPVLHMQQYFSVADVTMALQQVALRRQQQHHRYYYDHPKTGVKEFKRSPGAGFNKGQRGTEIPKEVVSANVDGNSSGNVRSGEKFEEAKSGGDGDTGQLEDKDLSGVTSKGNAESQLKSSGHSEENLCQNSEAETLPMDDHYSPKEYDSHSSQTQNEKQNLTISPKTFVVTEMINGKMDNVVDGLKLYEKLLVESEVSKLVSLVNDLRAAGRRGQFQGQTYVMSKRPMKGRGRETIQLGLPIADPTVEDDIAAGTSKDRRIESIPTSLQEIIDRLVGLQVMTIKPDSCIIDIYNEGDHSQPHMLPPWFGKPVYILFLTECDLTFGKAIPADHPGDYRGALKLELAPGSLVSMQGRSSDYAKHAIPAIRKQRMLVTFAKSQPKKFASGETQRLPSPASSSHWGPPPSRSPNHMRHPGPKHYATIPTTGVLPAPSIRPQIPPPNGVQPLFVTAPVPAPMPFAAPVPIQPVSAGWPTAPPRHPSNRLPVPVPIPVPGTGVFLPPPGSGNTPSLISMSATEVSIPVETTSVSEKENGSGKSDHGSSSSLDGKPERQDCNGTAEGRTTVLKEQEQQQQQQQQSVDHTKANMSDGTV